jgi:hypothetical protein
MHDEPGKKYSDSPLAKSAGPQYVAAATVAAVQHEGTSGTFPKNTEISLRNSPPRWEMARIGFEISGAPIN